MPSKDARLSSIRGSTIQQDVSDTDRREIVFQSDNPRTCFGCGPDNPDGLRLRFFEVPEGVEVEYAVAERHGGAPGVVHGGIQATLIDEALCMTAYAKEGTAVVTGELTVRYMAPLPTETPILIRSKITGSKGNSFFAEAEIFVQGNPEAITRGKARLFAADAD